MKKLITKIFVLFTVSAFLVNQAAWAAGGSYHHHHHGPLVTSLDGLTITDGRGFIKQRGDVLIIKLFSPNAEVTGNLSTGINEIIKVLFGKKVTDGTAVLNSNTGTPTITDGSWFSNGNLIFLNPAGFVVDATGKIVAKSIIMSTLNDANIMSDLASGKLQFTGQGKYIINDGRLIAQPGGYVSLLSNAIENNGTILAKTGHIVLAAGEGITLDTIALDDNGEVFAVITDADKNAIFGPDGTQIKTGISNTGTISANGGVVALTVKSLNQVFDHSINNTGLIEANNVGTDAEGNVVLKTNGDVQNSGTVQGGNVTIKAKAGINSTGSLTATDNMKLISKGAIDTTGSLISSNLFERGETLQIGGIFAPGMANIKNADGALEYSSDTIVSGTIEDAVNIIIDPNVYIILGGNTIFKADSGDFTMGSGSTINGWGIYTLSINAGTDVDTSAGTITGISGLSITGGNNVTLGAINNVNFYVNATATNGTLTTEGVINTNYGDVNLTAGQDIDQENDINTNGGAVTFNAGNNINQTHAINTSGGNVSLTAAQTIDQQGSINTANGNYTANAQNYYLDNEGTAPSISTGTGTPDIFASLVGEIGPGWGFSSNTTTNYDWAYLGGAMGANLIEFGYYFNLGGTLIYVPSVSVGVGGDINSPVSGTQGFLNIDVSGDDANGGQYILINSGSVGAPYFPAYGNYRWYSDPALNNDGQTVHAMIVAAANEAAFLSNNNAYGTPYSSLATPNPNGSIYNWDDDYGSYNTAGQYYNDVIIESTPVVPPPNNPPPTPTVGGNIFGIFQTNLKVNKIIYETLSPYQLSTNTVQQPLVYFYHPLTPVDQSAFDGISLDQGAYDFIDNNLQVNNLPGYFGSK